MFGLLLPLALTSGCGEQADGDSNPWPAGPILVHDASPWDASIEAALRQWNRALREVEFVETPDRQDADVLIVADSDRLEEECGGCGARSGPVGYRPGKPSLVILPNPQDDDRRAKVDTVRSLMHELGHILGIGHLRGYAIMSGDPIGPPPFYRQPGRTRYACGPYPRDLRALRDLYPRTPPIADPWCRGSFRRP